MKDRVAILAKTKSDCTSLLRDLKETWVRRHEVFFSWEDLWVSEQKNKYDFILIDYCFFDMFRDDMVCYHLFHQFKFKITFYSSISESIETPQGGAEVDLYRMFFRPFVDFNEMTIGSKNNNISTVLQQDNVVRMNIEKDSELMHRNDFFLKDGYSLIRFHLDEILCLESERNYITIYLCSGKHLIRRTLQSTLEILPEDFYQINRSVVVNINKVDKIVGNRVYIKELINFRPIISNKYKRDILNAVPLFNEAI